MRALLVAAGWICLAGCGLVLPLDAPAPHDAATRADAMLIDAATHDAPTGIDAAMDARLDALLDAAPSTDASSFDAPSGDASTTCPSGQHWSAEFHECVPTFRLVAAGSRHSCAVAGDADLYCWGENVLGGLGTEDSSVRVVRPSRVHTALTAEARIVALDAAYGATCFVTDAGGVHCWGDNLNQWLVLDDTENEIVTRPSPVPGVSSAVDVSLGEHFACAVVASEFAADTVARSAIACWGRNGDWQLGDSALAGATYALGPTELRPSNVTPHEFTSLATGARHACASTDDAVYCWGAHDDGQLGVPEIVAGKAEFDDRMPLMGFTELDASGNQTCGLDGSVVKCWGGLTSVRGLGPAAGLARHLVQEIRDVMAEEVSVGETFACARGVGTVWCWGENRYAQTGRDAAAAETYLAAAVPPFVGGVRAAAIHTGAAHACAIDDAGDVLCWGLDNSEQLGVDDDEEAREAAVVSIVDGAGEVSVSGVYAGARTTCVVTDTHRLYCWGNARERHLGPSVVRAIAEMPARIDLGAPFESDVRSVSVGRFHTCVTTRDDDVYCTGKNHFGQLGHDPTALPSTTEWVPTLPTTVLLVAAVGDAHTCVVRTNTAMTTRGIWCFGSNAVGQAPPTSGPAPRSISLGGLDATGTLVAGAAHNCAAAVGTTPPTPLWCWGGNSTAQTAPPSSSTSAAPAPIELPVAVGGVLADLDVSASVVGASASHTCAGHEAAGLTGLVCWGDNRFEQTGAARSKSAVALSMVGERIAAVALGASHTCALSATGGGETRLRCFGADHFRQLGAESDAPWRPDARDVLLPGGVSTGATGPSGLAAGDAHTCALVGLASGGRRLACWGDVLDGALGNRVLGFRAAPARTLAPIGAP